MSAGGSTGDALRHSYDPDEEIPFVPVSSYFKHQPEIITAATEDDLVGNEFSAIHTDNHITKLPFQAELVEDGAGHRAALPLHVCG